MRIFRLQSQPLYCLKIIAFISYIYRTVRHVTTSVCEINIAVGKMLLFPLNRTSFKMILGRSLDPFSLAV